MSYIKEGVPGASAAGSAFIESIRRGAACAIGVQERNNPRAAVTIDVFADQGAERA
jgi:hypothetical protein